MDLPQRENKQKSKYLFIYLLLFLLNTGSRSFSQTVTFPSDTQKTTGEKPILEFPQFIGGEKELTRFLQSNIVHHAKAKNKRIGGTVYAAFTVDSTGKIINAKIIQGASEELNKEVLNIIKAMPDWIPGRQDGKLVNVDCNLPVNFPVYPGTYSFGSEETLTESPHFQKGLDYMDSKNYTFAIVQFTMCILENDTFIDAYYNRGAAYFKSARKSSACQDWQRALELGDSSCQRLIDKHCNQNSSVTIIGDSIRNHDEDKVFTIVEEMPHFPGGEEALTRFFESQIKYPENARRNYIEGKVYVIFIVTKEGKIKDSRILKGKDPELDTEAIRVANKMPDWIPGRQNGLPLNVQYVISIPFRIK